MSGGHFDYRQFHIEQTANEIEQTILKAGREIPEDVLKREWYGYGFGYDDDNIEKFYPDYSSKTIAIMKRAVYVLRMAYIYAQRIDWMLSGDDGEESLAERLAEELDELRKKYPSGRFTFKKRKIRYDEEYEGYREMTDEDEQQ